MSKRPDARTFANCICFDEGCFVNEWRFHEVRVQVSVELHRRIGKDEQQSCFNDFENCCLLSALRLAAALHYQVANGHNNNENGNDGHPVKSHRSGVLL